MATFVAIQAVVKNGFQCTYAVASTTAPCSRAQQYKELDLDLESRTITKVAVGTTFSIFLHTINYLLGAIHVSLNTCLCCCFFSFTFLGYFVWGFLHMEYKFHSANSFGIDYAALFSNKNMTLLNGFCSVQLLGVIDTTVGFSGVAESNTAGGKQITVESV